MTLSAWFSLLLISILGAASPGPSLAVVIRNTLSGNAFSGILTAWAHALGIGVYAFFSLWGLALFLLKMPLLFAAIANCGALYLLWLGSNALRSKGGVAQTLHQGKRNNYRQCLRDGAMISLLNPKIGLFFIALFSQFINIEMSLRGKIITIITPLLTDGLWYSMIALTLSQAKILLLLRRHAMWVDRISGAVLIAVALRILWQNFYA